MLSGDTCYWLWNIHRYSHEAKICFQIILTTVLNYVNILILKSLMQCHNCIRMSKIWIAKISHLVLDSLYSCERAAMELRGRKASALERERQGVMVRCEPFFGQGKKQWGTLNFQRWSCTQYVLQDISHAYWCEDLTVSNQETILHGWNGVRRGKVRQAKARRGLLRRPKGYVPRVSCVEMWPLSEHINIPHSLASRAARPCRRKISSCRVIFWW